mgnify:CR=1 FL=1
MITLILFALGGLLIGASAAALMPPLFEDEQ